MGYARKALPLLGMAALLAGCGSDFEEHYSQTDRPVLFLCHGNHMTESYKPAGLSLRASKNADTPFYRNYFLERVGKDFLDYTTLDGYYDEPPAHYQDRPLPGNVLPYKDYAIAYYYIDASGSLQPMEMYFGSFADGMTLNAAEGPVQFPYRIWLMAPSEARYIVTRSFDNIGKFKHEHKDGEWELNIDEVWHARQADDHLRAHWKEGYPEAKRTLDEPVPLDALSRSRMTTCSASQYEKVENDGLDMRGLDIEYVDEYRESEAQRYAEWVERPGFEFNPNDYAPDKLPGSVRNAGPEDDMYGIPFVARSKEELMEKIEAGELDYSWSDDLWRPTLL